MADAGRLAAEVAAGRRLAGDAVAKAVAAAREQAGLGAFWALGADRALGRAGEIDAHDPTGRSRLPLAGVPFAVKDNLDLAGLPTTGGLRGKHPAAEADAAAVTRLESAGAIAIGKTAMDPLAWSTHGQAEGFPTCLNPIDSRLSPGGSSAGSAVAVAAEIVPLALGTDTAGSLRIPAAFCGITALKPAWGDIVADGCLPLAPSFDTIGVLARSVGACATAYEALAGRAVAPKLGEGRIGVLADLFEASEPSVAAACARVLPLLQGAGLVLEEVRLDWWAPAFGLLLAVEFADAWGARAAREPERFPPRILEAIARAQTIDAARQNRVRSELTAARTTLSGRLRRFAALLSPTVPVPVPAVEEEKVEISTRFTRIFNALGWPALTVPCGADRRGHPVGMHVASARDVSAAVAVAALVERYSAEINHQ